MTQILTPSVVVRQPGQAIVWPLVDTTATLASILAPGYLTSLQVAGENFQPQDAFYISYVGGSGYFTPSFNGSIISLVPLAGTKIITQATVTAATFNAMYTTPTLIVPALGAGYVALPTTMLLNMTYGSAPFASGGVVALQWGNTNHGGGVLATNTEAAADFFATANTLFQFDGVSGNTVGALPKASVANTALYLSNQTGVFTGGTGTSFVATVYSQVLAV